MSPKVKCPCQSCTIRGFVGPAVVITVGVLLLLNEIQGSHFYFGNTWPVILIVIGLMHLASATASRVGHSDGQPAASTPPAPPSSPATPAQTSHSAQGQ